MNPFLFLLFFTITVICSPFPTTYSNLWPREVTILPESNDLTQRSHLVYNIFPSNVENEEQLSTTRAYLQSISDYDIEEIDLPNSKDAFHWKVSMRNSASTQILKDREGISSFEVDDQSLEDRAVRSRQDDMTVYWEALARDPSNKAEVRQTREWLDKTVKNKTIVSELKELPEPGTGADWDNRNTVGWYALILDDIGAEEAKRQPGIQLIEKSGTQVDFGTTTAAIKRSTNNLSKRVPLEWTKQANAQDDLVEISKYK
jgi:hypothetical protein